MFPLLIQNCEYEFQFQCPKEWSALRTTDDERIRQCDVCGKPVYHCETPIELKKRALNNQCAVVFSGDGSALTGRIVRRDNDEASK